MAAFDSIVWNARCKFARKSYGNLALVDAFNETKVANTLLFFWVKLRISLDYQVFTLAQKTLL